MVPKSELHLLYSHTEDAAVQLGEHVGSGGAPCFANLNELLGKHTAVLGATGAGKSAAVAALTHSILDFGTLSKLQDCRNPRIIILDPHNGSPAAFPSHSRLCTDDGSLVLPYWLLSFQETTSLLIGKTEYVATSQTNIVKAALLTARKEGAVALGLRDDKITVDSPVPYSLARLRQLIDQDKPPQASKQDSHLSILDKIDVLVRDTRLHFLMAECVPNLPDPLPGVLSQLVGGAGQPRIIDLSGVPNEVAGICSAVVARTLFSLKVWQTAEERSVDPILLVCEEAHRYVPNRGEAQYEAAQEAIRRIAKEGRKYGWG